MPNAPSGCCEMPSAAVVEPVKQYLCEECIVGESDESIVFRMKYGDNWEVKVYSKEYYKGYMVVRGKKSVVLSLLNGEGRARRRFITKKLMITCITP